MITIYRNGSFFLIGFPSGPIQIKETLPFLQSERVFRGSILGGRYIVELMLEFASRHNIKAAVEDYPMVNQKDVAIDMCIDIFSLSLSLFSLAI